MVLFHFFRKCLVNPNLCAIISPPGKKWVPVASRLSQFLANPLAVHRKTPAM
jgi:hypothetical protein